MSLLRSVFLLLAFVTLLPACGVVTRTIVKYSFEPAAAETGELTKDDVTIRSEVIGPSDCDDEPQLCKKLTYLIEDRGYEIENQKSFWIVPTPLFEVSVRNDTEHVLRFGGTVIKMADSHGQMFELADKDGLVADVRAGLESQGVVGKDVARATGDLRAMSILGPNAEILPGYTQRFFALFLVGEYYPPFKLMIFDLTTATDEAGEVSRKTKFEFNFRMYQTTETWEMDRGSGRKQMVDSEMVEFRP